MSAYKINFEHTIMTTTDAIADTIVSLPLYPSLTNEQVVYIADAVEATGLLIT